VRTQSVVGHTGMVLFTKQPLKSIRKYTQSIIATRLVLLKQVDLLLILKFVFLNAKYPKSISCKSYEIIPCFNYLITILFWGITFIYPCSGTVAGTDFFHC